MNILSIQVDASAGQGMRLDRYCAMKEKSITRSRLKMAAIKISINGKVSRLGKMVKSGDLIEIEWEDPVPDHIEAEQIPLDILFENDSVTVVNKPQGMVTHPAAGNWKGTLVNALLFHWGQHRQENNLRPGIVHRLDKDTSGVIITARTPEAESFLQAEFANRAAKKQYVAILQGTPKALTGDIKTRIVRDPGNRKRFACTDKQEAGKFAHTGYRVVRQYGPYTLVVFSLFTGRTHQLRVHSKYLGAPILGDPVYGKKDRVFTDATLMLHAYKLSIHLPGNPRRTLFCAPLPRRFRQILDRLKELYPQ